MKSVLEFFITVVGKIVEFLIITFIILCIVKLIGYILAPIVIGFLSIFGPPGIVESFLTETFLTNTIDIWGAEYILMCLLSIIALLGNFGKEK